MIKYFFCAVASILFNLVAWLGGNFVVCLFANSDGNLPSWLSWFQTQDATLDGDSGWQTTLTFLNQQPTYPGFVNAILKYLKRVAWLYRNTGYSFSYYVLGETMVAGPNIVHTGSPLIQNKPNIIEGSLYVYDNSKPWYSRTFCYYHIKGWSIFGYQFCFRMYLGWKCKDMGLTPQPASSVGMVVFNVWPFMGYFA